MVTPNKVPPMLGNPYIAAAPRLTIYLLSETSSVLALKWGFGFRVLGFLGFRVLGFKVLGFRV